MGTMTGGEVLFYVLLDLALILVAARALGYLFVRMRQPRVVGEIVAGVLLGPTLWGTMTTEVFPSQSVSVLGGIGQFGLLLFSFLVGLEVEIPPLKERLRTVVIVGLGVVLIPVLFGFAIGPALSNPTFQVEGTSDTGFVLFVGAILAVTALPVMVRILQEKGLTLSRLGAVGIAAASVCTVAMFVTSSVASSVSQGEGTGPIVLKLGATAGYLVGMIYLIRPISRRLIAPFRKTGELDASVLSLLFIVLVISGVIAQGLGLTVIVGGFMAGVILPARKPLFAILDARFGHFTAAILLPVFLAVSGLATDFRSLTTNAIGGLIVLLAAAIVSKWAGGAVSARLGGMSWSDGNVIGILMNCRGLMVLVVALVGIQDGVITPTLQLGAVLIALITNAMTGPLFDASIRRTPVSAET
ncbi:MAG: hypothetical protein DWQ40_06560 [Actinobacteria bacterium]|nr:MAG: hypothetical protein DWQ40_06560 [Actinomycetota bacterium]